MQQISLPKATLEEESKGSITTGKEKEIDFTMIIKKTCIKEGEKIRSIVKLLRGIPSSSRILNSVGGRRSAF